MSGFLVASSTAGSASTPIKTAWTHRKCREVRVEHERPNKVSAVGHSKGDDSGDVLDTVLGGNDGGGTDGNADLG
jgi:uncharacterized protein YcfJ